MKHRKLLLNLYTAVLLLITASAQASVINPKLDIQDIDASDTGLSWTTSSLDVDATAFAIVTDTGIIDITDLDFSLHATGSLAEPVPGVFSGSVSGGFSIGGGTALTGSFTGMTVAVNSLGGQFFGDVMYDSGYMAGSLTGGRIEGSWTSNGGVITGMAAKLGPVVVPVPPAVWLFGTGLIGLIGIARRTRA